MISGPLDESYPSKANIKELTLHTILLVTQILLLVSLPVLGFLSWLVPGVVPILFLVTFWLLMQWSSNYRGMCLIGLPEGLGPVNDEHELWFFINRVVTGMNWLQSNLDLLARTFQYMIF